VQLHIRKRGEEPKGQVPSGYAPIHSARPLDELDEEIIIAEPEEASTWKTSRRVPMMLFAAAVLVLFGIIFFAREFQSEEPLERVIVEGNHELQSKEVLTIAAIDRNSKFYELDLRSIEQRIAKHGLVRRVSIRREMHPNTIVIHVDERLPLAMIRSSNGEPILVDNDLRFFLPKKLSGLIDPNKLLAVPVLTGITEKDTAAILEMSKIVRTIETTGDSSLREAMGELRRTPTGAYVIYTSATQTPIFIGSPTDVKYSTTLERDANKVTQQTQQSLFDHQIQLLASLWKEKLRTEIWSRSALYVDARFGGQVVVHHKNFTARSASLPKLDSTVAHTSDSAKGMYHITANTIR
jgi:cell division septal protein FtsQ